MLRVVMVLGLTVSLAGVAMADPAPASQKTPIDRYQEPNAALLLQQRELIDRSLKEGEILHKSQSFKDTLQEERARAAVVPNAFPSNKLELPADVQNQRWADRFNELEAQANHAAHTPLDGSHVVLVFASFSLPEATLKTLAAQAKKAGGIVVFRGLKNDDFIEMRKALAGLGEGFAIDPTLFQRFNIESVPAFVLPVDPVMPCNPDGCPTGRHAKVAGNVTLEAALDYINTNSQTEGAKTLSSDFLKRLREK